MVAVEVRSANRSPWHSLNPVLHVAAGAVDLLIEKTAVGLGLAQRGHDEPRIRLALGPFRLADHPAPARPAVERRIAEVLAAAGGLHARSCSISSACRARVPAGSASICPLPARSRCAKPEACPPDRHQRVVTKPIVIVQVLVAERDAEHTLADERGDRVLDEPWVSRVAETSREPPNFNSDAGPRRPTAGRLRSTSAPRHRTRRPPAGLQPVQMRSVLRCTPSASGHPCKSAQVVLAKQLLLIRRPDALIV